VGKGKKKGQKGSLFQKMLLAMELTGKINALCNSRNLVFRF
jgi:hypothetical protein